MPRINLHLLLALTAGALSSLAFAPLGMYPLAPIGLAMPFVLLVSQKQTRPFLTGWLFGLGFFGVGVSWIYVSLHFYGSMSAPLTLLVTSAFCAFLALFPGCLGSLQHRIRASEATRLLILLPAIWTLLEWVRGWILTGFPWLAIGYSQVPDSPLAGFAPVLGVYGVGFLVALTAGALAFIWQTRASLARASKGLALIVLLFGLGFALGMVHWTHPQGGAITVALVQGNIPQEMKWDPEMEEATLQTYRELAGSSQARLIVLPEGALPVFYSELSETYIDDLRQIGQARGGDLLAGLFTGGEMATYMNSVASFGSSPTEFYNKHHLVPFGEFIPPGFGWVRQVLHIPFSDVSRGEIDQPPLSVAGQKVAINICYEDVFGEEIIRSLPEATILANVSDDAWFGDGFAARQHRQISQMRALETGRMMLRATNTGSTAIIDAKGRVVSELALFQRGILQGRAQGYAGATPYVRWGNVPVILATMLMVAVILVAGIKRQQ